jgi:hypothetical protein
MKKIPILAFFAGFLAIGLGLCDEAWADKDHKRPYKYVSLDEAVPEGFFIFDIGVITDSGRVYVTLLQCDPECLTFVAVYHRNEMTVLHEGFVITANNRGKAGGGAIGDMDETQAALFTRSEVEFIPRLPDELFSAVIRLTNSGIALVESFDSNFNISRYLTRRGHVTPLDFGPDPATLFDIDDRGLISGTSDRLDNDRAFRYHPSSGRLPLLEPLPTETSSWGLGINRRGDVLGYSFIDGGLERIGVWRGTKFRTYFVEGTLEFPTVSNRLLWNERGLIVITDVRAPESDLSSYLVPRRGVRLNLADLTKGPLPAWTFIRDINNRGDLIGWGGEERDSATSFFLLRRVGPLVGRKHRDTHDLAVASSPGTEAAAAGPRVLHPSALERFLQERLPGGLGKDPPAESAELSGE